jgi:hypothetical protein
MKWKFDHPPRSASRFTGEPEPAETEQLDGRPREKGISAEAGTRGTTSIDKGRA